MHDFKTAPTPANIPIPTWRKIFIIPIPATIRKRRPEGCNRRVFGNFSAGWLRTNIRLSGCSIGCCWPPCRWRDWRSRRFWCPGYESCQRDVVVRNSNGCWRLNASGQQKQQKDNQGYWLHCFSSTEISLPVEITVKTRQPPASILTWDFPMPLQQIGRHPGSHAPQTTRPQMTCQTMSVQK